MDASDRHRLAAEGFLELGLPREAAEELDAIPSADVADQRVTTLRVETCRALALWGRMESHARLLCRERPDDAYGWINLAYATRRAHSLERALDVLLNAVKRFPQEGTVHFNLACYEAQLGRLDAARIRLAEAIRLQPAYRQMAADDPDLAPLRDGPA